MRHLSLVLRAALRALSAAALAALLTTRLTRPLTTPRAAPAAALLLAAGLSLPPAQAGRPLATDDAAVVAPQACQLELWHERSRGSRAQWANAGCNPFGSTEFALGASRLREDGERATPTAWQVKHLLREVQDDAPGFAVALRGERDRRVHAGLRLGDTAFNAIATWPLRSDALVLHANLGLLRQRDATGEGPRARSRGTWAAALDGQAAAATRWSLEAYGAGSERPQWQAGLRHEVREGVQLDFAFGAQAGRWNTTRQASVGLVIVAPVLR